MLKIADYRMEYDICFVNVWSIAITMLILHLFIGYFLAKIQKNAELPKKEEKLYIIPNH